MIKQRKWPNPADTPLDRARTIARDALTLLARHHPDEANRFRTHVENLGETWITPQPALYDLDDWITLEEAAAHTNGTRDMIYKWTRTHPDLVPTTRDNRGRLLVQLGNVVQMQADQRKRRARRHAS